MVVRSALPQNYIISSQTLVEPFATLDGWSYVGTPQGNMELDTINFIETPAIKVNVTTAGSNVVIRKAITIPASYRRRMVLYFYVPVVADFSNIIIKFSNESSGYTNFVRKTRSSVTQGWNTVNISIPQIEATYGWNQVSGNVLGNAFLQCWIQVTAASGHTLSLTLDSMYFGHDSRPRCMIVFDDGCESVYSKGFPICQAAGIPTTIYHVPAYTGQAGYCSLAQLTEMAAAGWTIANHTYDHTDLTTQNETEQRAAISAAISWLNANGFSRGAYHLAYPLGHYNSTTLSVAAELGMLTGRTTTLDFIYTNLLPSFFLLPPILNIGIPTTLNNILVAIENAKLMGSSIILYGHEILDAPVTTGISTANFQAVVDFLKYNRMKCVTVDEWYRGLTNPRYRSLPVGRSWP